MFGSVSTKAKTLIACDLLVSEHALPRLAEIFTELGLGSAPLKLEGQERRKGRFLSSDKIVFPVEINSHVLHFRDLTHDGYDVRPRPAI